LKLLGDIWFSDGGAILWSSEPDIAVNPTTPKGKAEVKERYIDRRLIAP
jgi:hypothetical protein